MRSTRLKALRTIHDLIPACSEDIRMVRKLQPKRCTQNHIVAMQYELNEHHHQVAHVFIFLRLKWPFRELESVILQCTQPGF